MITFTHSEFIKSYGLVIVVWLGLLPILALPEYTIFQAFLQTVFLLFWSYFGHWFMHKISQEGPLSKINPHIFIHHKHEYNVPRWFNLFIETLTNAAGFLVLLPLTDLFGNHILSPSLLFASMFLYIIIHIFDYSIFGNEEHKEHHAMHMCNYAPDFVDALMGTRCDPKAPLKDRSNEILHGFIAFGLAYVIKQKYNLA